jgi:predicted O-methyltransferase YrrM
MSTTNHDGVSSSVVQAALFERIARVRELQAQLRKRPVTGSLRGLKKILFQALRSTFSRQFAVNAATIDLIESLSRDLDRLRLHVHRRSGDAAAQPPPASSGPAIAFGEVMASCGMTQDQAKLNNIRPLVGFDAVYSAPAELRMPERVALYGLVFGLQPKHCLEIGTFRGGSTAIICGALDDTGCGELACVDPTPQVDPVLWARLAGRCRMFEGPSPDILPEVAREVGAAFDFAFIDGNHTHAFVKRDIAAVLPLMADDAHLLFHDANYPDVERAIDESVAEHRELVDCGLVSVEPTIFRDGDTETTWAGLRLLRFRRGK